MNNLYDQLAPLYDKLYSYKDYSGEVSFLATLHKNKHAKVLDLACGTGRHIQHMAKQGWRITGVDSGAGAVATAKKITPGAEFYVADMVDFVCESKKQYNLVTCLFSSVQYITNPNRLTELFKSVYQCLASDGVFVFDLRYAKEHWQDGHIVYSSYKDSDVQISMVGMPFVDGDMATWNPTIFWKGKDGKINFEVDSHQIKIYATPDVEKMLTNAGFKVTLHNGFSPKKYNGKVPPVFVARKIQ